MNQVFWGLSGQQWIEIGISVLILLGVLLLGRWIINLVLEKLLFRITKRTKNNLDNQVLDAARLPLYLLAVVLALDTALRRLSFLPMDWNSWLKEGFFISYFLVGFIFAWRLVTHFFRWYEEEIAQKTETNLNKQLFPFFERIVLMLLSTIGIF